MSSTISSSILISHEKRTACAACADAIEASYNAMPKAEKKHWWQRDSLVTAIAHLRQMAQFGNGGGILTYTKNATVLAIAAEYGIAVADVPRKADDAACLRLAAGQAMRAARLSYLRD
jgi:hypothetical protein